MGETQNIAEIASVISKDIFKYFLWHCHPKKDDNFECVNDQHRSDSDKKKGTHPTDVVFSYDDPYSRNRINLLTDLKSYAGKSISYIKIRQALSSLAMSVECAGQSSQWRQKFGITESEANEVRGLLFVHNHDLKYKKSFEDELKRVQINTLPIAAGSFIYYLGPADIQRLYTIANDIIRLIGQDELPKSYGFYYPDLVIHRRIRATDGQPATFESLSGPFLIIKHGAADGVSAGYLIYYNRPGSEIKEFEYLIDCFSRFQMLNDNEKIRVRVVHNESHSDLKSIFSNACRSYSRSWGFDDERSRMVDAISIERVTAVTADYNPGDMGWR